MHTIKKIIFFSVFLNCGTSVTQTLTQKWTQFKSVTLPLANCRNRGETNKACSQRVAKTAKKQDELIHMINNYNNPIEIDKFIKDNKLSLDFMTFRMEIPIFLAINQKNVPLLKILIQNGARNVYDSSRRVQALTYAEKLGDENTITFLKNSELKIKAN